MLAAISTGERRAPFAGGAAGFSPVNFATKLLEVKSSSRRFTASIIKSQSLGLLVVPICCIPPACPRQEGAATWSQCDLEPDPSLVLNRGGHARSMGWTLCPCSASLLVGTGTPGQCHAGRRAWLPGNHISSWYSWSFCSTAIIATICIF